MPRVVANQSERFQNDDIFQKLSRETEIKYVGYRDRPLEERQLRFQTECREGNTSIAFTATGVNIELVFPKQSDTQTIPPENVDFYREKDKVFLRSPFIMNGVCVIFVGWLNIIKLDGVGYIIFDEERAKVEDEIMRETLRKANIKLEEFQEKIRSETSEVQNTRM
ncbi:core-binding factor subunit beta-like isoform X2 [Dendronephthya gigantea]|uniref:core-binding factor subunit beta-like isoform X2 n=1 Tax=Dendronephthya gigantea TaxID=151771 RepID=UPI00106D882B|nr:core-binding factor subunit beta-like isoform X2 [Dendronephthya gigantea]